MVCADAADDDVAAAPGRDGVIAAQGGVGGPDPVEVGRVAVGQDEVDQTVVAKDHARLIGEHARLAPVGGHRVVAGPAEHDVGADATGDGVVAADRRVRRDDQADEQLKAIRRVAVPTVPRHSHGQQLQGGEVSGGEGDGGIPSGGDDAGSEPEDATAVADDDVATGAAVDPVCALSTEDHQRQGRGRGVDGVVVGPAEAWRDHRVDVAAGHLDEDEGRATEAIRACVEGQGRPGQRGRGQHAVDEDADGDDGVGPDAQPGDIEGLCAAEATGPDRAGRGGDGNGVAGNQRVEQADQVQTTVDDVAGRVDGQAVDRHREHLVGGDDLVADLEVRQGEDVVRRALGVEDEEAVLALGEGDDDVVVAESGVEPGGRAQTCALVGSVDADRVGARAAPDPDAVGEGAGCVGAVGDACGGEPDDKDLAGGGQGRVAGPGGGHDVGDEHVRVADVGAFVADQEGMPPRPEIEVEGARDGVQVTGKELRVIGEAHVGQR